jgi:hypothetical protein
VSALGPIDALLVLKIATLSAVAFMPASWAYLHLRFFPSGVRPAWVFLAYYVAFFGIERTLLFAVPFAGKNALILGLCFLPIVAVACVAASRRVALWPAGVLALFGLVLINYALLHAAAALLGSLALALFLSRRLPIGRVLGIALMGAGAAALMFIFLREAMSDPRAGKFVFYGLRGLRLIADTFFSEKSPFVIYDDTDFGIVQFHYRGAFLVACFLAAVLIGARKGATQVGWAAVAILGAIILILLFTFSVIPAGITGDYGRWILWPFQAALMATALVALFHLAFDDRRYASIIGSSALAAAGIAAVYLFSLDAGVFSRSNAKQVLSRDQLYSLATLTQYPEKCFFIAPSHSALRQLVTAQQSRLLDYAEIVTPCTYANGSWVQPGVENGRADDGLPPDTVLRQLTQEAATYFLGTTEQAEAYRSRHQDFDFKDIGRLGKYGMWQVAPLPAGT